MVTYVEGEDRRWKMGEISYKCLRVVTAFLKILYLDGLRSEVEQFSMRVHPFDIFLLNSAFYSLHTGWLKVNSERGENVG